MTDTAIQSIPVSVLIGPIDHATQVRYSYIDPVSNEPVSDSEACILNAVPPYEAIFTLDAQSVSNGWTLSGILPKEGSSLPWSKLAGDKLSLTTLDDGSASDYRFYLCFYNTPTGESFQDDPQENNLPKPKAP